MKLKAKHESRLSYFSFKRMKWRRGFVNAHAHHVSALGLDERLNNKQISFKRLVPGAFNVGLIGMTCAPPYGGEGGDDDDYGDEDVERDAVHDRRVGSVTSG